MKGWFISCQVSISQVYAKEAVPSLPLFPMEVTNYKETKPNLGRLHRGESQIWVLQRQLVLREEVAEE
ncbi:hypothetical protein ACQP3C_28700, partial [Escherichia coli]